MADTGRHFKLNDFMANIRSKGILRTNRYEMTISFNGEPLRKIIKSSLGLDGHEKLMSLRCDAVQLPGMTFATVDGFLRFGYGAPETIPYAAVFDQLSASFIVDANSRVHMFFYHWVNFISNFRTKGQNQLNTVTLPQTGSKPYELSYRNDYAAQIEIKVFDESTDKWSLKATAYNAFPKGMPQSDLSYSADNEMMKLTIPFAYSDYTIDYNYLPARETTADATKTSVSEAIATGSTDTFASSPAIPLNIPTTNT